MFKIKFPVPLVVPTAANGDGDAYKPTSTMPLRDIVELVHFAVHAAGGECSNYIPYLSSAAGITKYLCLPEPRPDILILPEAHTWVKYAYKNLPWQDSWSDDATYPFTPNTVRDARWDHSEYRLFIAVDLSYFSAYYRGRARLFKDRTLCTAWTIVDAGDGTAVSFSLDSFVIWDDPDNVPYDNLDLMAAKASAWTHRVWRDAVLPFSRCECSLLKVTLDTLAAYSGELPDIITLH